MIPGSSPGRLPLPIKWLSDNGSPYTARVSRALAREIGLVPCTTPIENPQSNGMAEAFPPREFRKQLQETTEDAVGAGRRPHHSPMSAAAIGQAHQPRAARRREASGLT